MPNTSWSGHRRSFSTATRRRILDRHPICNHCGLEPSTVADHIIPHAEGGTDDEHNGQGLCQGCHDIKTQQERTRGLHRASAARPTRSRTAERHPGLA